MTRRIFRSILLAALAVLLASLVIILGLLYEYFASVQESQLKDELGVAAAAVENGGADYLAALDTMYRFTWIAPDGSVRYDTGASSDTLENHAERSEVRDALATGEGESVRYSSTLLEKTMYYARRLDDGSVLRVSVARATIGVLLLGMLQPIVIVLAVALVLSALLAKRLAARIVQPLNSLDLDHPLENDVYEELSPLLGRLAHQRRQIDEQLRELQRRSDEFAQITASMREGLVLLDNTGRVLSINPAARRLFGADDGCVGQDFLTVDRSADMSRAIESAMSDGHSETRSERDGRVWQFDVSRIDSEGDTAGAVLLAFDITERESAEQMRREFTANVSHELKTPLQGIIGSAELLENGMVKPEDMPRFVGHIRAEAQRLVTLIGDIIRLSELDEGMELGFETADLLPLAQEVAHDLQETAAKRNVRIAVEGEGAPVSGVRRLLYEIIYNLCDNAIKYNVDGGSVTVTLSSDEGGATLTVRDTGIGIAPEHQSRVFERFYRVDKSHSKASGGTGLGLSIVKHAAACHHAALTLQSEPGLGTSVTLRFPPVNA